MTVPGRQPATRKKSFGRFGPLLPLTGRDPEPPPIRRSRTILYRHTADAQEPWAAAELSGAEGRNQRSYGSSLHSGSLVSSGLRRCSQGTWPSISSPACWVFRPAGARQAIVLQPRSAICLDLLHGLLGWRI